MAATGYPIRAVSRLTGLPVDTLRAWERRYQAVRPRRGGRGRLYGEADVRRLISLRELVEQGYAIGQVARLSDRQLQALIERQMAAGSGAGLSSRGRREARPRFEQVQAVLDALHRWDCVAADRELSRLATVLPARDVIHRVVVPLMHAVGEQWHSGRMSIAQEHLASALVRNLLGGMMRLYAPEAPPARLMFSTPAGEEHEFGILAAAMLAAGAGMGVVYLGPDLPAGELVQAARRAQPEALVLGLSGKETTPGLLSEIQGIARKLPTSTELWIGGKVAESVQRQTGGRPVVWLPDFQAFEQQLRRLGGAI
jgi:DNA-binding transcriptional MerR regulator/methylmalonyl-CoA mutase cobalamin-binding subunit